MTISANWQQGNKIAWIGLGLILLVIAVCANPWQLYFLNDDFIHIPMAYDGTIGHDNSLRHINDLSLYLDSLLSKEYAAGYHLTNLVIYCANILLAVPLLKKIATSLLYPVSTKMAVAIVGLFGVYAFHSEALFWILCRTASLCFFFNLLCWHCLFQSIKQRWWLLPMVVTFLLSMFTYEAVWVFPFWLLAWYFLLPKDKKYRRAALLPVSIIGLLFVAYLPLRLKATGEMLGTYEANDIQQFHVLSIIEKSLKLFARSFLPPVENARLFVVIALVAICGLLYFGWLLWKKAKGNKLLWFFLIAWLLSYFPYISLGVSTRGYESERYLYYPSFFLCAMVVYGGWLLWNKRPRQLWGFLAILFLYQFVFLIKASQVYKAISHYSKTGIAAIQKVPLTKKIVIRHLPVYSNGLPVFYYGFFNAVVWLAPGRDSMDVTILDKTDFKKEKIVVTSDTTGPVADTLTFSAR